MSRAIIDLTDTGYEIGDLTWDWCIATKSDTIFSTDNAALVERGNGIYIIDNPTVGEDADFRVHVTVTPENFAVGTFHAYTIQQLQNDIDEMLSDYFKVFGIIFAGYLTGDNQTFTVSLAVDQPSDIKDLSGYSVIFTSGPCQYAFRKIAASHFDVQEDMWVLTLDRPLPQAPAQYDNLLLSVLPSLDGTFPRLLGLMMENHVEDDITRNAYGLKTSSRLYLYDSKDNAQLHDKATGLIGTYTVAVTYNAQQQISLFSVVQDD